MYKGFLLLSLLIMGCDINVGGVTGTATGTLAHPETSAALQKPVVAAAYSIAPNWMDYVDKVNTNSSCSGSELTYNDCIHGGEVKRVSTGQLSCASLFASDFLGAFNWTCVMENNEAIFYSSLKSGKGLTDLVQSGSFKPNSVTVTNTLLSSSSDPAVWWGNTITSLPSNPTGSTPAALTSSGTIYYTDTSIYTAGYNLNADKVGIVTLGGATISYNSAGGTNANSDGTPGSGYRTTLASGGHKFLWIEGSYNMVEDGGGIETLWLVNMSFSRLNLVHSQHGVPIYLYQSNADLVTNVEVFNSYDFGLYLDTTTNTVVTNSTAHDNNSHYGFAMGNGQNDTFDHLKITSGFGGLRVFNNTAPNYINMICDDSTLAGIYMPTNSYANYYTNLFISNISTYAAIYVDRSTNQNINGATIYNATTSVERNSDTGTVLDNVNVVSSAFTCPF